MKVFHGQAIQKMVRVWEGEDLQKERIIKRRGSQRPVALFVPPFVYGFATDFFIFVIDCIFDTNLIYACNRYYPE